MAMIARVLLLATFLVTVSFLPFGGTARAQDSSVSVGSTGYSWSYGVLVGFNLLGMTYFPGVKYDAPGVATDSASLRYKTSANGVVGLETSYTRPNGWGLSTGFLWDFPRRLNGATFSTRVGSPTDQFSGESEISSYTLYLNGVRRWERIYVPIGISYSLVTLTNAPPILRGVKNGASIQLGIGYFWDDVWAIELLGRGVGVEAQPVSIGTEAFDAGSGAVESVTLAVKYLGAF